VSIQLDEEQLGADFWPPRHPMFISLAKRAAFMTDSAYRGMLERIAADYGRDCPAADLLSLFDAHREQKRRLQRGFGTLELAAIVVAIGLLVAAFFAVKSMVDNARTDGYTAGRKAALLEVAQRDNAELGAALERIRDLEREKADEEQAHRDAVQKIDVEHEREVARVRFEKDRLIADLRGGAVRLRGHGGQADTGGAAGGCRPAAGAAGAAGERDAPAAGGPGAAVEGADDDALADAVFTLGLLAEGDEAITDLTACQAIVVDDRRAAPPH
jgi:hypothetical protein